MKRVELQEGSGKILTSTLLNSKVNSFREVCHCSIDADVILAAQALLMAAAGDIVIVATTNVGHLNRIIVAQRWQDITP